MPLHVPLAAAVLIAAAATAFPPAPLQAQPPLQRVERSQPQRVEHPRVLQRLPVLQIQAAAPTRERASLQEVFTLGPAFGDRQVFAFTLGGPGRIQVDAGWRGTAEGLALILNGPGQTQAYARENGASPLRLDFEVTEELFRRGREWKVSIVNFGRRGMARGRLVAHYPAVSVPIAQLAPVLRRLGTEAVAQPTPPPDRDERSILPDGRVQVRHPDGRVTIYEEGCGYTMIFPDGTSSRAMCNQVQPATMPALPDDPALKEFLEAHRDSLLSYISRLVANDQAQVDLYLAYEASQNPEVPRQIQLRSRLIEKLLP